MSSESSRQEVEARLRETADAMSDRLSSLEEEVSSSRTVLRDWIVENPWKSIGGMLVAGLTVGMLFGGRRSRRPEHAQLLDQYIDALRAEVDEAVAAGTSPGEALEEALRNRAPLVVYERGGSSEESVLRQGMGFILHTAFREVARNFLRSLLDDADIEGTLDDEL